MKNINISFTEKEIYRLNAILLNNIAQLNPNIPDKDLQFYVNLHNKITGDVLSIKNVREHFLNNKQKN